MKRVLLFLTISLLLISCAKEGKSKEEIIGYFGVTVPPISVKWCH
ncbi:hypothetical protein [Aquimarina algiphila]|nr:hypothetical protein [Aquimarina algiphila]